MTVSLRRASRRNTPDLPEPFRAPLFYELVTGLDEEKRHVVLDLGAASTAVLALLGRSRCRVEIADLAHFGGIQFLNSRETGGELVEAAASLLPARLTDEAIDLVFCWDLPNYLTLDALSALMGAIADRARPGAMVHALVRYAERDMSEQPGRFIPVDDSALVDHAVPGSLTTAPRYSPEDLCRSMGRFEIDRARLLSNGMQEFLFVSR